MRSAPPALGSAPRWTRRGLLAAALLGLFLALPACGDPRPPGGFGRLDTREGLPDRLVLEGTPYEMGWWHGRLLRARIRALAEDVVGPFWRRSAQQHSQDAVDAAMRKAWTDHLDLCVDQTLYRLSERLLQELEGMAASTGLEPKDLIALDVARDALRMKGLEAGLPGAAGIGLVEGGCEARIFWGGVDAAWLAEHAIVIQRKPSGARENVALAWPGSVGALAAAAAGGRGYGVAEVDIRDRRRMGFGGGRPFAIAAREALQTSADAGDLLAASTATMGHLFLGFVVHPDATPPVQALAGVGAFQGTPDPLYALGEDAFLALGPYEDAASPAVKDLREAVVETPGLQIEERWLRLREHAGRRGGADGPEVHIRWQPGRTTFSFQRASDGAPREVVLQD